MDLRMDGSMIEKQLIVIRLRWSGGFMSCGIVARDDLGGIRFAQAGARC